MHLPLSQANSTSRHSKNKREDLHYFRNSEDIIKEAIENTSAGIQIVGKTINNLRYADDTTLLCGNKEDMVGLLGRVQKLSEKKRPKGYS